MISKERFEDLYTYDAGFYAPEILDQILDFLRVNPDKAYTQSEISVQTNIELDDVTPALVHLRDENRVESKAGYWRIKDSEGEAASC